MTIAARAHALCTRVRCAHVWRTSVPALLTKEERHSFITRMNKCFSHLLHLHIFSPHTEGGQGNPAPTRMTWAHSGPQLGRWALRDGHCFCKCSQRCSSHGLQICGHHPRGHAGPLQPLFLPISETPALSSISSKDSQGVPCAGTGVHLVLSRGVTALSILPAPPALATADPLPSAVLPPAGRHAAGGLFILASPPPFRAHGVPPCLFMAESSFPSSLVPSHGLDGPQCICPSAPEGRLGCCQGLAVMSNVHGQVHIFVWV